MTLMTQLSEKDPFAAIIYGKDGKTPKPILHNALLMLRHDPAWEGVLAFNEFTKRVVTVKPAPWQEKGGGDWTDDLDSLATDWLQSEGIFVPTNISREAIKVAARDNPIHPVRSYLLGLKWDSKPRINKWLSAYMGATDTAFVQAVGARWLIAAVARIFRPGCQSDHTLMLEGPQGIYKSSALRTLAGDEYFTDHISDFRDKDSKMELLGKWIIEFSELATVKRGRLEEVKNFLTGRIDYFRLPYGHRPENVPRSCTFAATTNESTPLVDETGNRRFWPVRCTTIDINGLKRDRDQLWAEAYAQFKAGDVWWLNTKELTDAAAVEQDERYESDIWASTILDWCDRPHRRSEAPEPCISEIDRVTIDDIWVHALGKDIGDAQQGHKNRIAGCLRHAGWIRRQRRVVQDGKDRRVWFYERGEDE